MAELPFQYLMIVMPAEFCLLQRLYSVTLDVFLEISDNAW